MPSERERSILRTSGGKSFAGKGTFSYGRTYLSHAALWDGKLLSGEWALSKAISIRNAKLESINSPLVLKGWTHTLWSCMSSLWAPIAKVWPILRLLFFPAQTHRQKTFENKFPERYGWFCNTTEQKLQTACKHHVVVIQSALMQLQPHTVWQL